MVCKLKKQHTPHLLRLCFLFPTGGKLLAEYLLDTKGWQPLQINQCATENQLI